MACILPCMECAGFEDTINTRLQSIPQDDYNILEDFFSYMISYEFFGYVLHGTKPMAAGGFDTHFTIENTLSEAASSHRWIRLCWETWEKYAALFPSEFILRLSKNPVSPSFYWIILININSCLRCIESNLDIFKKVLGDAVTPQSILDDLSTKEDIFNDVLKRHDGILGILFGYGRDNAMTFYRQKKALEVLNYLFQRNKISDIPMKKLFPFNPYNRDLIVFDLPRFAESKEGKEYIQLHTSYENTWKKLPRIYKPGQFLKTTLKKLISDEE